MHLFLENRGLSPKAKAVNFQPINIEYQVNKFGVCDLRIDFDTSDKDVYLFSFGIT